MLESALLVGRAYKNEGRGIKMTKAGLGPTLAVIKNVPGSIRGRFHETL